MSYRRRRSGTHGVRLMKCILTTKQCNIITTSVLVYLVIFCDDSRGICSMVVVRIVLAKDDDGIIYMPVLFFISPAIYIIIILLLLNHPSCESRCESLSGSFFLARNRFFTKLVITIWATSDSRTYILTCNSYTLSKHYKIQHFLSTFYVKFLKPHKKKRDA